jgi:hypothetical protein
MLVCAISLLLQRVCPNNGGLLAGQQNVWRQLPQLGAVASTEPGCHLGEGGFFDKKCYFCLPSSWPCAIASSVSAAGPVPPGIASRPAVFPPEFPGCMIKQTKTFGPRRWTEIDEWIGT